MQNVLNGYKVIITGACSGIGLSTAKEFLAKGATVINFDRNIENLPDLGDNFTSFQCDVEKIEEWKKSLMKQWIAQTIFWFAPI